MLQYLKNHEIDRQKWDLCVNNSPNKLIYANTWFLDIVSPGWEAIINSDYTMVMPVPVKSFLGYKYVVQPLLTKQLGIFSTEIINNSLVGAFIEKLINKYKYIRLNVNSNTVISDDRFAVKLKNNHELNLDQAYHEIKNGYKRRAIRNIKRAHNYNITCRNGIKQEDFLLFANQYTDYINKKDFRTYLGLLREMIIKANECIKTEIYGTFNSSGNMISTGLIINDEKRKYFIFNVSDQEGIRAQSMYLLIDSFIKQHAGENAILDFTGSDMKGVAYFLESFGAEPHSYQYIEYKNLPFPVNFMVR